jgi:hypothetical protein
MKAPKNTANKHRRKNKPSAWQRSAAFRLVACAALHRYNLSRHLRPKCGAHARSTGQPCGNVAMQNGRCHVHGGKTPKGKSWHVPQWPKSDAPNAIDKMNGKLAALARREKAKRKKLAAMTAEERQAHDAWQKARKPGSASARASERAVREHDDWAREFFARQRKEEPAPAAVPPKGEPSDKKATGPAFPELWPNIGVFE